MAVQAGFPSGLPEMHSIFLSFPIAGFLLVPCLVMILMLLQPKGPKMDVNGPWLGQLFCGIDTKFAFLSGKSAHKFHSLHKNYGNVVKFAPGQATTNTIKALRNIYGSGVGKGNTFLKSNFYKGISRRNIFTASDPSYHATIRKLFSPSLSPGCMMAHESVMKNCIGRLHNVLREKMQHDNTLDLNDLLYCHAVDTVSEVLVGKPLDCLKRGQPLFWTEQLPRIFYWATIRDQFQGSGVPTMIKWLLRRVVLKGVRARNESARMQLINEQMHAPHSRRDIMVEVLERAAGSTLPEAEIAENFSAIMLAGFHTTANTLCAVIYFVLTHPEVHSKLVAELQAHFSSVDDMTIEVAQKLPYLNAVITESLRLYPPVPLGGPRVSPGAYVDGTYVPAGVEICTSLFALHHNPEYFNDPFTFHPERWTEPGCTDKKEAVQPFLVGSRSCIAKHFAQHMLYLTLAAFFIDFDGDYIGRIKDWQKDSKCYAFWEVPDLKVQMCTRRFP